MESGEGNLPIFPLFDLVYDCSMGVFPHQGQVSAVILKTTSATWG